MFSRFIEVVTRNTTLFLYMAEYYSIAWIHCILTVCSSAGEYLGCFHFLARMSNAAMDTYEHIFGWTYVFDAFMYIPRSEIAVLPGNSIFNFSGTNELFPKVAMSFYIPISNV